MPSDPLVLQQCYGLSSISNAVINLSTPDADAGGSQICYAAAQHVVVLAAGEAGQQHILQPACTQAIAILAASADRNIVAVADGANPGVLTAWHVRSRTCLGSWTAVHGIAALHLSADGSHAALLSRIDAANDQQVQELAIWPLRDLLGTELVDAPLRGSLPLFGGPHSGLCGRWKDPELRQVVSTGPLSCCFWEAADGRLTGQLAKPTDSRTIKTAKFTDTTFIPGCDDQAITVTASGEAVMWHRQRETPKGPLLWCQTKAVKLHAAAINLVVATEQHIVTGCDGGFVRIFDAQLRLIAWFEELHAGPITSISFSFTSSAAKTSEATAASEVANFDVGTSSGACLSVRAASFHEEPSETKAHTALMPVVTRSATVIAAHPHQQVLAVASARGVVQRWDMSSRTAATTECTLTGCAISALCYSHSGTWLVAGTVNGHIYLLSDDSLAILGDLQHSKRVVSRLAVDSSDMFLAAATDTGAVLLYRRKDGEYRMEFAGRCKAHSAPIVGLCFGESPAGKTRLFSLAADNNIAEYKLDDASVSGGLHAATVQPMCRAPGVQPTALTFAPPLSYYTKGNKDTLLLASDAAGSLRLWSADSSCCIMTCRGPTTRGAPIIQLSICRAIEDQVHILFAGADGSAGFIGWPIDGNPAQISKSSLSLGSIAGLALSADCSRVIALGAGCDTLYVLQVDAGVLPLAQHACTENWASAALEQSGRTTYPLEHEDSFKPTGAVLLDRGVCVSSAALQVVDRDQSLADSRYPSFADSLPATQIFPSEGAIQDLKDEMWYRKKLQQNTDLVPSITAEDAAIVLMNHEAEHVGLVGLRDVQAAFAALGSGTDGRMPIGDLATALGHLGEPMPETEFTSALSKCAGRSNYDAELIDAELYWHLIHGSEASLQPMDVPE